MLEKALSDHQMALRCGRQLRPNQRSGGPYSSVESEDWGSVSVSQYNCCSEAIYVAQAGKLCWGPRRPPPDTASKVARLCAQRRAPFAPIAPLRRPLRCATLCHTPCGKPPCSLPALSRPAPFPVSTPPGPGSRSTVPLSRADALMRPGRDTGGCRNRQPAVPPLWPPAF